MARPFTIYKLTVLYLLKTADMPLSNTQISDFFLGQDYTDYFRVQEVISQLIRGGLITEESDHRDTRYLLTGLGRETLNLSIDKLNDAIRKDVIDFLAQNRIALRDENSASANYDRTADMRYAINCKLTGDNRPLLELNLTVSTQKQAEAICSNWEKKSGQVYADILDLLLN